MAVLEMPPEKQRLLSVANALSGKSSGCFPLQIHSLGGNGIGLNRVCFYVRRVTCKCVCTLRFGEAKYSTHYVYYFYAYLLRLFFSHDSIGHHELETLTEANQKPRKPAQAAQVRTQNPNRSVLTPDPLIPHDDRRMLLFRATSS